MNGISKIFNPKSIAVIGASSKPGKIGHECFRSLLKGGFRGKLYPINPNVQEILGVKTYSSILDIQGDIDLVIYALQAKDSVRIFREIGQKGVRAAIIISGGFRESSNSGILLEEDVIRIARDNHIRIIGPNCVGVYDGYSKVDSFFSLPRGYQDRIKDQFLLFHRVELLLLIFSTGRLMMA